MHKNLRVCAHCILPETFPGVSFNEDGLCNHCQNLHGRESKLSDDKKKYERKFLGLLSNLGIHSDYSTPTANRPAYDILMAYSGGKDSTYTMGLLKIKYKLRILAVSFDNGFISETSIKNIKNVTDILGIDHVFFKPAWEILKKIFSTAAEREFYSKKTLERASTICTSCIGLVKSVCLKTAIEQDIPMVGFGWSPGQAPVQSSIMKNNPSLTKIAQQVIMSPLREIVGNEIDAYFLQEKHYSSPERFPVNVHPMAWEYYNEEMIMEEIEKFGWMAPRDTDSNSTNCLLNAFANDIHMKRYGFHPYVWEVANMVREGIMTREKGYKKIYAEHAEHLADIAKDRLRK